MIKIKTYKIHLIRHGMTMANVNGQYAGVWDVPVCEEGIKKLENLKQSYEYPKVDEVYSSPLTRCLQTARIIYPDINAEVVENFKEWDFGEWEGKTTKELMQDPHYVKWVESGRALSVPGGESGEEFGKRICTAFEGMVNSIIKRGIENTAIFTHGGVIMSLLTTYGIPKARFWDWICDNGCGYSLSIMPSFWMRDKVLEVYEKVPKGSNSQIDGKFKELIDKLK